MNKLKQKELAKQQLINQLTKFEKYLTCCSSVYIDLFDKCIDEIILFNFKDIMVSITSDPCICISLINNDLKLHIDLYNKETENLYVYSLYENDELILRNSSNILTELTQILNK